MDRLPRGVEERLQQTSGGDKKKQKHERVREADAYNWLDHNVRLKDFFFFHSRVRCV